MGRRPSGTPTLQDVADAAYVSVTTASRALNDAAKVAPETVRLVHDAAARLGYEVPPVVSVCACQCCPHRGRRQRPS